MPFVAYSDIVNFLPKGLENELKKDDVFTALEAESAKLIRDITGVDIPSSVGSRPDWSVAPSAYFIIKFASMKLSSASDEFMKNVNTDYERAVAYLKTKASRGIATETVYEATGDITTNLNAW